MSLVSLVHSSSSSLETLPDLLSELLSNRTELLPLLMKFLKFTESLNHILVLSKFLSKLAELLLSLKILLEVKVTKLTIYLDHIVELFNIELICLIDVSIALSRNRTHSSPAILDLTELRECLIHILLLLKKSLKISHDSLLLSKILLTLLLKLLIILGTFLLKVDIKCLESSFDFHKRICCRFLFNRSLSFSLHLSLYIWLHNLLYNKSSLSLLLLKSLVEC